MNLFTEKIDNWHDWERVFQSIPAFVSLTEYILSKENLPSAKIENLTPGTNAVFKIGAYAVKIFAPAESGIDQTLDLQTELFATQRANELGISAPRLIAHGFVEDRYHFAYMITEYVNGIEFTQAVKTMTDDEKIAFARKLRAVTDIMNTPCEPFNGIDVINDKGRYRRWEKYPESFQAERLAYIKTRDFGERVFVHGDLCGDNILLKPEVGLCIIDFADAVLAPQIYEHALVAVELFDFDPALLHGYFGDCSADELMRICFDGLLIHDFGGDVVEQHVGSPREFQGLDELRQMIKTKIKVTNY
jgi:thiamine kinase-like enzyme